MSGEEVQVHTTDGKNVVANISKVFPKDTGTSPGGVDDMTKLSYLHEPGVLHNLAARYELKEIYTYRGNILIAINPFQRLQHLYDTHIMEQYKRAAFGELSPHVFAVAEVAYKTMINEGKSNSILVCGESGAGKTETTEMLMRYLAYPGGQSRVEGQTVKQQVLESNPVLEAFDIAKTVRNNNSRRKKKSVPPADSNQGCSVQQPNIVEGGSTALQQHTVEGFAGNEDKKDTVRHMHVDGQDEHGESIKEGEDLRERQEGIH